MFSVGDYELKADFAKLNTGNMGQQFYVSPNAKVKPQNPNAGVSRVMQPNTSVTGITHVPGKGKTYVKTNAKGVKAKMNSGGAGVRKSHIRNIDGKAVQVGQSLIKAGRKTAGSLAASAKANLGKAGLIGAGVAAVGAGTAVLTRKKRERR